MAEREKGHTAKDLLRESPHYEEIQGRPGMFAYIGPSRKPNSRVVREAQAALIIKKAAERRKNEGK